VANIHSQLEVRFPRLNYSLYGQGIEGRVESCSITSDFLTACDGFTVTYNDIDPNFWPEAQPLEIYLDGALQLIGRAEDVHRGGGKTTATITGRDYLADLTQCDVDASFVAKTGMTLEQVLLNVMAPCGITSIATPLERNSTRSKATGGNRSIADTKLKKLTAKQVHDLRPKPGEKVFAYANRLVVRCGATIQPSVRRNEIVLQGPTYDDSLPRPKIISRHGSPQNQGNNAIAPESIRKWSEVPTYMMCANQTKRVMDTKTAHNIFEIDIKEKAAQFFNLSNPEFANIFGIMLQGRILPGQTRAQSLEGGDLYRLRYLRDLKSRDQDQIDGFGYRMLANVLKDTLHYTTKVRGGSDENTGLIWSVDTQADVEDDTNRVWEKLWISSKVLDWSTSGVVNALTCWRPKTFQPEIPD
jgi:hypothetical protein